MKPPGQLTTEEARDASKENNNADEVKIEQGAPLHELSQTGNNSESVEKKTDAADASKDTINPADETDAQRASTDNNTETTVVKEDGGGLIIIGDEQLHDAIQ